MRPDQWFPGDADRYPAVYRHPRDDGFGARLAQYYTQGNPISFLSDSFTAIGQGAMPVIIFFVIAAVFHIALKHTRYGKYVYAIGGNMTSAKVSGINVNKYLVIVYTIAGALSGLAGVVLAARVSSGQSSMGMSYELDAIAAAVIGGSSLMGGVGRITGTLIGAMILGLIKSGFTFVGVDAYVQDIIKRHHYRCGGNHRYASQPEKTLILSTGGNGEGCRCRPSCPEINKILPARLRLSVLPALRILYSFATSVVHSSGATCGLRFLESYEYTILWQILAALASGKKGPYRHAARGAGDPGARSGHEFAGQRGLP
ncbi:inositol transport system permease protein [Klebsiella pneumoniae]|uniref:Inositol transport system permease protein n=1 Tax=Klebsiella pneumoniae TaxID=573 RepID=A0A377TPJ0_KLEPN|nr:inositol transport system permease protein [Klebsiella pneumoniae]